MIPRIRRLISPSVIIDAPKYFTKSIARVAIKSADQGTQANNLIELFANNLLTSASHAWLCWNESKISARSGRVRPDSSTGALNLFTTTPKRFGLFLPPNREAAASTRSFNSVGVSVAGAATNTISASKACAIS